MRESAKYEEGQLSLVTQVDDDKYKFAAQVLHETEF